MGTLNFKKSHLAKFPLIGKYFFVVGIMAIAIEHFVYNDFIIGRAPAWPANVPGQTLWAYVSGAFFLTMGIMILLKIQVRRVALLGASLVFVWAFVRYLPIVISDSILAPSWTSAGKAMVFTGGLLAIVATSTDLKTLARQRSMLFITGRICLGIFLLITGLQHFIFVEFVASLIPEWFPGNPVFWTYFAGAALLSGGTGLLIPRTATWAALLSGIMMFSWFWIVHLPLATDSVSSSISLFEALAFSGIAFVLMNPDILKQE